jgi:diguanylate cyclase (GGDEF)-like protein
MDQRSTYHRYAMAGAVLVVLHFVVPEGRPSDLVYVATGASSVAAIIAGVRIHRPAAPRPWLLMAAGQALWVAGDFAYDENANATVAWSDALYLVAYPVLALGIADLIWRRRRHASLGNLIDSAIVVIAIGLLAWVFVADPIVDDTSRSIAARAAAVAYPAGDIVLMAMLVTLLTVPGVRSTTYRLLASSILLLLVADTAFAAVPQPNGSVLDLLWLSSYVGWGLAALHPTMAELADAPATRRSPFTTRRLVALTGSVLIAPALGLAQVLAGTHVDTWLLVGGASLLSLLVVARMSLNIDELRSTTRQRDDLESRLLHQASHDAVTGVANGASMRQLITLTLRRGQRTGTATTVLLVEIDDFETLVARRGHAVGDEVLRVTAARLCSLTADPEHVGRLDGHRFLLLIDPTYRPGAVATLDERLMQAVSEPFVVDGRSVDVSACVGAAVSMDGGTAADDLIDQAHVALRRAKATGRGTFEIFGNGLRHEMLERRDVEAALERAMEDGDLALQYEPVVAAQTEIVDGYEAQIHWWRPDHGWQDPARFLAIAAESDLVCRLEMWAITTAVQHLATRTSQDPQRFADLAMAVPVSGRTLSSPGFVDAIGTVLAQAGVEPHRLTISVAEMTLVDVPHAVLVMTTLQDRGVFVGIHEFGTGHTPLARLDSLPADVLKIDESLVNSDDPGAVELLALLVHAAHGCGMLAVASGVTDHGRLAALRSMHYDSIQGMPSWSDDLATSVSAGDATPPRPARPHLFVVPDLPRS